MAAITAQATRLAIAERRRRHAHRACRARAHRAGYQVRRLAADEPTPAQRLQQINDARTRAVNELDQTALTYRRAYGLEPGVLNRRM